MLSTWLGLSRIQMSHPARPGYHHLQGVSRASWPHVVTTSFVETSEGTCLSPGGVSGTACSHCPTGLWGTPCTRLGRWGLEVGPKADGRQREKQEPARSVPEGKGPAPGHRVYYRQRGPPQGTHTTGGPIPAPGHPSVHLPTLSALLPGYQSNHTLTHLSSRHGANSQEFKPRVPRSPVLGPPVISRINGDFPYLISPNPGAMARVSDTSTTHMVSFLQLPNPPGGAS